MTVHLFDTRTGSLTELVPVVADQVGVYVCGPTVQSAPHIGHLRSALIYDQLRRWLEYRGYAVTLIRNVTDIDDKILALAGTERWWQLAYRIELEFTAAYNALGILPPTYEPRATGNIPQMIALIERIISAGHAYVADDGSGDVYFDTASWPDYGELTKQSIDDMEPAADGDQRGKRDPRDFALWKGRKESEPTDASWASPWGEGRPGWHIECSAMSTRYLGAEFDIHGGGLDLRFPHHENELAQSRAAGDSFARIWMHNGLVSVGSQKMSKSLGNSVFAAELLERAAPLVVRYYLGSAHYRSTLEYDPARSLEEASAAVERITGFIERANVRLAGTRFQSELVATAVPDEFGAAMDDDLGVPAALAVLHETVRAANAALADEDLARVAELYGHVLAMVEVLGLNPEQFAATSRAETSRDAALSALVGSRLAARQAARAERDFAHADAIRDELSAAGVQIEDTTFGPQWSING